MFVAVLLLATAGVPAMFARLVGHDRRSVQQGVRRLDDSTTRGISPGRALPAPRAASSLPVSVDTRRMWQSRA